MTISKFDTAAEGFSASINHIAATAASLIPQARDALTHGSTIAPSPESAAELCLRGLSSRIEDLMVLHDRLYESIGMSPRYWAFFDSLNLTDEGWRQLRQLLKEHATGTVE